MEIELKACTLACELGVVQVAIMFTQSLVWDTVKLPHLLDSPTDNHYVVELMNNVFHFFWHSGTKSSAYWEGEEKKIGTRPFVLFLFFFQRLIALYTHVRFVQDGASCDLFLALLPFCISVMNRLAYGKMLLPPEAYKHTYIQIGERKKKSKAFQHPFILSQFRLPSHPLPPSFPILECFLVPLGYFPSA